MLQSARSIRSGRHVTGRAKTEFANELHIPERLEIMKDVGTLAAFSLPAQHKLPAELVVRPRADFFWNSEPKT